MAFCMKCGAPLPEDANVCPQCGTVIASENVACAAPVSNDRTGDFPESERVKLRFILALGYLFPFFFIFPMILYKDNALVRFHLGQAINLLMGMFACAVVMIVPILGWIAGGIGSLVLTVILIIALINVLTKKAKVLPLVGNWDILPDKL